MLVGLWDETYEEDYEKDIAICIKGKIYIM